ncbi:hypothetical protein FANTH_4552 [Fusarium anthophilum]|uniref:NACHT domain-containing protein n=1 Tax=Fusarium anthophilum TaxID=48485 RepID=A0A8H4ZP41_9HYPO|nr:hypothetical protein FANTH_4552 [Fusarium anthophilum]
MASFEKSLDLFRRGLSDNQIKQMDGVDRMTLNNTMQTIQNTLGHRNELCKLIRVQRFFKEMGEVVKPVATFLRANDSFEALVWGPIHLALIISITWTDAVRQLIDAYEEIAEALGNLAFFHNPVQSGGHLKLGETLQAQEMKSYLASRLGVLESRADLRFESDPSVQNSGRWIASYPIFKSWASESSSENKVLFLNGSPGCGKSTLARRIIRDQKEKQASEPPGRSFLAFFHFKRDVADRRTALSMLQHLIMQLVNQDETIMRFAHEKLSSMEAMGWADMKNMAYDCLTSRQNTTLVLDGLDEAIENEHEVTIKWCLDELLPAAASCGCDLKILICGRASERLDVLLSSYPQIRLNMINAHQQDIDQFIKGKVADIHARLMLEQEKETLIAKISGASQGMFLYARLVLDHLAAIDSTQEFEDELEDDTFPENLDRVYGRITQRIMRKPGSSRCKTVMKILGWVICAARPLRWREIQSRFCIDADKETFNMKSKRLDSCKSICSSLFDVTNCDLFPDIESEQIVSMVHETATTYLVGSGTIDLFEEHINMALFCSHYLSSRPFTTYKSQSISANGHWGYFGFMDYAAAHYAVHVQKVQTSEISTHSSSRLEDVKAAAVGLNKAYCKEIPLQVEQSNKTTQDLNLAIERNVLLVRTIINMERDKSQIASIETTEGLRRHKCHKTQCSKFATGFSNEAALKEHLAVHERPFRCPHIDCFANTAGYASLKRLESHDKTFHQTTSKAKVKAVFPTELETGEWNLYEACKVGDLDEVKRFHGEKIDLNGSHTEAASPLCAAVEAGHGHVCRPHSWWLTSRASHTDVGWFKLAVTSHLNQHIDEVFSNLPTNHQIDLVHHAEHIKQDAEKLIRARCVQELKYIDCDTNLKVNPNPWLRSFVPTLRSTPDKLDELYNRTFERSGIPDELLRVLSIIAASQRPLALDEIDVALAVQPDDNFARQVQERCHVDITQYLHHVCGPFIRIQDFKRVSISHKTAIEFLLLSADATRSSIGSRMYQHEGCLGVAEVNQCLAEICVVYLTLDGAVSDASLLDRRADVGNEGFDNEVYPNVEESSGQTCRKSGRSASLFNYAAKYWGTHYSLSHDFSSGSTGSCGNHTIFSKAIALCNTSACTFHDWFQPVLENYQPGPEVPGQPHPSYDSFTFRFPGSYA